MKGLRCGILENKGYANCSNGGISSRVNSVILTGPGVPEIFEPSERCPEVQLKIMELGGKTYLRCEPTEGKDEGQVGWMHGGCFIYTFDSRFPSAYPIPLHDRQETHELHKKLSI